MAVKEGYKQSEIGVIPEDWEVAKLRDCVENTRLGGNYRNSELFTQYPLIKMGNLGRGTVNLEKIEYIVGVVPSELDKLQYADLLFNTRNTLELVGKVAIWRNELKEAYYNSNIMRIVFKRDFIATNFFVNYMLNSDLMIRKLSEIAIGTTSVAAIYNRDLLNLNIPIPPLPEQKAIATALSDIDGLINSLSKLIEKKKNIKQGAMQELLTGKKRLEGFSGEWLEVRLGDIASVTMGQSPDSKYYNVMQGGLPLIQGNADIRKRKTIIRNYTSQITRTAQAGDIIMTVRAPVGYIGKALFDCCIGRGVCSIRYKSDYLYYYLIFIEDNWAKLSAGSTFHSVSTKEINDLLIKIPSSIEEQAAIANILSDMDNEIEKLQSRLDKYKAIKQGMMQELLTGRIRLLEGA